jgi:O-antigen ligase
MSRALRHIAIPLFVLLCMLLGGSQQGIWRSFILQAGGALLIAWALLSARRTSPTPAGRGLLLLAGLWFLLVLLQLVPLPPALWTALPGRELVVQAFTLRGQPLPWLPLSLTPAETAEILPAMLVPLGVLAGMLLLGAFRSRWCLAALLTGVLFSVLLGAVQITSGGPYLYPIHNTGATGLFANGNHQGTLLLLSIPFFAAMIGREVRNRTGKANEGLSRMIIAAGGLVLVVVGLLLNGSMAALLLSIPVGLASLILTVPRAWAWRGAGALVVALLLGLAGLLAWQSDAGSSDVSFTSRAEIYDKTATAIADSFPAGTGLGSFDQVYRFYEDPAVVDRFYVNNAHSDPLEWVLETGLPGALLLLAFLVWWVRLAWRWARGEGSDPMVGAGVIASAAILAHSLVDYPLRDPAIQALFALCLAFMADPRSHVHGRREEGSAARAPRHLGLDD